MTLDEAKKQIAPQLATAKVFGELMFTQGQFDALLEYIFLAGEVSGKEGTAAIVERAFARDLETVT